MKRAIEYFLNHGWQDRVFIFLGSLAIIAWVPGGAIPQAVLIVILCEQVQ